MSYNKWSAFTFGNIFYISQDTKVQQPNNQKDTTNTYLIPLVNNLTKLQEHMLNNQDLFNVKNDVLFNPKDLNSKEFDFIINHTSDVFWNFRASDFRINFLSPNIQYVRGYTKNEILKQDLNENFTPNSFSNFIEKINSLVTEIIKTNKAEKIDLGIYEQPHKNGSTVFTRIKVIFHINKKNNGLEVFGISQDVTVLQRLTNKNKGVLLQNKLISDLTIEAIILHSNGVPIDFNNQFIKLFGYSADELRTINLIDNLISPEYIDFVKTKISNGNTHNYQVVCIKKDGTKFLAEIEAKNEVIDGQKVRLTAIRDLTNQKKREEELRIQNEILTEAQSVSKMGSWVYSIESDTYQFSAEMYRILELDNNTIIDSNVLSKRIYKDDLSLYISKHEQVIKGHEIEYEHRLYCGENCEILKWVLVKVKPIFNTNNTIVKFIGVVRDITSEKNQNELLALAHNDIQKSEERYRILFDKSPIMLHYIDANGLILNANKKWTEQTGYSIDEIIGQNAEKFFCFPKTKNSTEKITLGNDISMLTECQMHKKNGQIIDVLLSRKANTDNEGKVTGYIAFILDITTEKQTLIHLEETKKHLEKLNQTKDKFFSIIAHDLKNPLNNIKNLANMLNDIGNDKLSDSEIKHIYKLLKDSTKQTSELLDNLLEWSRLQTGSISLNPQKVFLSLLIIKSIKIVQFNAEAKNIKIDFINQIENEPKISLDERMIETVVRNLLSNAIKFTPNNGSIQVYQKLSNDGMLLSIKDNGIGIDERLKNKLFKIRENISTKGTNNEKGSGLGLVLIKEFIDKHKGDIWFESEKGYGSTFHFFLPMH